MPDIPGAHGEHEVEGAALPLPIVGTAPQTMGRNCAANQVAFVAPGPIAHMSRFSGSHGLTPGRPRNAGKSSARFDIYSRFVSELGLRRTASSIDAWRMWLLIVSRSA